MSPSSAPRVLHIVPALFGPKGILGGGERYALELAKNMARETPTRLLTFGERPGHERVGELDVEIAGPAWFVRGQRTNPVSHRLFSAVARSDVVHCHQQHVLATSLAALTARTLRKRVYVTDLGGGGWDLSRYFSTDNLFDGHLHLSIYSRRVFGHEDRADASVIWGGVDTDRFVPPGSVADARSPLFVGRVLPHKGVNYLVEAIPAGEALDVVGPTPDDAFRKKLEELGRGKDIRFHVSVPEEDLVSYYQRALCVILPSVYRTLDGHETRVPELLGQTLLEGMSCGLPAICTNVASMPELVEHEVTGFVVPPNDAGALRERIGWLSRNPQHASRMGRAARQKVLERFTWKPVVERCLQAYGAPRRRVSTAISEPTVGGASS